LLNSQTQLIELLRKAPLHLDQDVQSYYLTQPSNPTVPIWFLLHLLINASGDEILLPHESAGWTFLEYVEWFNKHSEIDRLKFFHNLIASYKQSVIAKGISQYVKYYPIISDILEQSGGN